MTDDEKSKYLKKHVRYEVMMLRYAYDKALDLAAGPDRNAFVESFAVHARSLFEMLTNQKDDPNRTILAEDFVGEFEAASRHKCRNEIKNKVTKINQQVLHLGSTRLKNIPKRQFNAHDGFTVIEWIEDRLEEFDREVKTKLNVVWLPSRPRRLPIPKGSKRGTSTEFQEMKVTVVSPADFKVVKKH